MTDATIQMPDGRTLGYADFGEAGATPVIWCHGGPGSRLEPKFVVPDATDRGLRIIGIDRPGYGLSTPRPGRSIEACVPDIMAVADALGLDQFYVVGVSTGGAYALAAAALTPTRVQGVVVACALTDMRNAEAKKTMIANTPILEAVWAARSRDGAIAAAVEQLGEDGTKLFAQAGEQQDRVAAADLALLQDPAYLGALAETLPQLFAWGVEGYADDRFADGGGWGGFDVASVSCPVIVAHGDADSIVPVETASVTAEVVPGARLRIFPGDGHLSVVRHVPALVSELAA